MNWQQYLNLYPNTVKRIGEYLFETNNVKAYSDNGNIIMKVGKKPVKINHFDFIEFFNYNNIILKHEINADNTMVAIIDREVHPVFSIRVEVEDSSNYFDVIIQVMSKKYEEIDKIVNDEITIEDAVNNAIKNVYGLTVEDINRETRKGEIVKARQIKMVVLTKLSKYNLGKTGMICGNKNHSTVLHAIKTFKNLYETDKDYRSKVAEIFKYIELTHPGSMLKLLNILELN